MWPGVSGGCVVERTRVCATHPFNKFTVAHIEDSGQGRDCRYSVSRPTRASTRQLMTSQLPWIQTIVISCGIFLQIVFYFEDTVSTKDLYFPQVFTLAYFAMSALYCIKMYIYFVNYTLLLCSVCEYVLKGALANCYRVIISIAFCTILPSIQAIFLRNVLYFCNE